MLVEVLAFYSKSGDRKIKLWNHQLIDVDKLYVNVYLLEKLTNKSYATIPDLLQGVNLRDDFNRLGMGQVDRDRLDLK